MSGHPSWDGGGVAPPVAVPPTGQSANSHTTPRGLPPAHQPSSYSLFWAQPAWGHHKGGAVTGMAHDTAPALLFLLEDLNIYSYLPLSTYLHLVNFYSSVKKSIQMSNTHGHISWPVTYIVYSLRASCASFLAVSNVLITFESWTSVPHPQVCSVRARTISVMLSNPLPASSWVCRIEYILINICEIKE